MGNKKKIILSGVLILYFTSCSYIQNTMPNKIENWNVTNFSKIRYYSEIEKFIKNQSENEYRVIGTVSYPNEEYKLYEIIIDNNAEKDILIFSGVHGNEPAGVKASIKFIKEIEKQSIVCNNYNIHIIPIVNPWGWEFDSRYNGDGVDINRDFANENTISNEAELIMNYYRDIKPAILFDLHESYSSGHYFYVYNNYLKKIAKEFCKINEIKYRIENNHKVSILKVRNGIILPNWFIIQLVKWADRAALANYFLGRSKAVTTIESSRNLDIENRINFHIDAINYIITKIGI